MSTATQGLAESKASAARAETAMRAYIAEILESPMEITEAEFTDLVQDLATDLCHLLRHRNADVIGTMQAAIEDFEIEARE